MGREAALLFCEEGARVCVALKWQETLRDKRIALAAVG